MVIKTTNVYSRIALAIAAGKTTIINEGGTSSSKTFSTLQLLIEIAATAKIPTLISIVAESFPHLRRGCIRDFKIIMGDDYDDDKWSASLSEYDFGKGKIEFFSADDASKLRGGRRDILFINEANNVTKEAKDELTSRTKKFTIIDFNPVSEFWAHEMKNYPEVEWIHSTYLDALDVLDRTVVDNIRVRKDRDPVWWRVYGLGLVGMIEGLIHPFFTQIDTLPEAGRIVYGLDFGYSMDPTALVKCVIQGEYLYCQELIYEKGLTNDQIAKRFETLGIRKGYDIIIADSAEPKSIDEIKAYGYDIRPCAKGPDSVNAGIQKVNQYKQCWTKDSLNGIKEQRNYRYEKDKDGKFTGKPIDDFCHLMDSRRYAVSTVPDHRIISNAPILRIEDFTLAWDRTVVPQAICYHYGAMSMTEDSRLHLVCAVWENQNGIMFVYHSEIIENIDPSTAVPAIAQIMHLNEFWFQKFLASDSMLSDDRSAARVINKEFAKACPAQTIKLKTPKRYDPFGAVSLLNQLVGQKRLIIHKSCEPLAISLQQWSAEKGKVKIDGLRESLLMLISELDQAENVMRPSVMAGGYKKTYEAHFGF